jgi:TPR repeat protein
MRRYARTSPITLCAVLVSVLMSSCGAGRGDADQRCEADDVDGCHELGTMKIHGWGGPSDRKGGRHALERACELGRADSCAVAGGLSYGRRDERARRFLARGCELGDPTSCVDLAWMVGHGEGGPADGEAARRHLHRACDAGSAAGCFFLGLEQRPAPGGRDDPAEMRRYFRRACELGDALACRRGSD